MRMRIAQILQVRLDWEIKCGQELIMMMFVWYCGILAWDICGPRCNKSLAVEQRQGAIFRNLSPKCSKL